MTLDVDAQSTRRYSLLRWAFRGHAFVTRCSACLSGGLQLKHGGVPFCPSLSERAGELAHNSGWDVPPEQDQRDRSVWSKACWESGGILEQNPAGNLPNPKDHPLRLPIIPTPLTEAFSCSCRAHLSGPGPWSGALSLGPLKNHADAPCLQAARWHSPNSAASGSRSLSHRTPGLPCTVVRPTPSRSAALTNDAASGSLAACLPPDTPVNRSGCQ